MDSDNPCGADNQQERLDAYIAGYVDGEGTFHVAVQRNQYTRTGWQLVPEFHVSQNAQGRASRILRDHMPNATRQGGKDMVRPAWRHAEPGRNDLAPRRRRCWWAVTIVSVPILHARRSLEESCP